MFALRSGFSDAAEWGLFAGYTFGWTQTSDVGAEGHEGSGVHF